MGREGAVELPEGVSAAQRARLHAGAEALGMPHRSEGPEGARRLRLGPRGAPLEALESARAVAPGELGGAGPFSDAALAALLLACLREDLAPALAGRAAGGGTRVSSESCAAFAARTAALLEAERGAEVAEAEAALADGAGLHRGMVQGRLLRGLLCAAVSSPGFLGEVRATFRRPVAGKTETKGGGMGEEGASSLPPHRVGVHDAVVVRPNKGPPGCPALAEGVVTRVEEDSITVVLQEGSEEDLEGSGTLRLEKVANEVTYRRLKQTLKDLEGQPSPGEGLRRIAFEGLEPRVQADPGVAETAGPTEGGACFANAGLDESQQRAVRLALGSKDLALVHGPPGTGKTTAVVEIVLQEVARGSRVLACASSNVAVDNLVERLARARKGLKIVRVGHPARLLPEVLAHSLEAQVLRSDSTKLAKKMQKEMRKITQKISRLKPHQRAERRGLRAELRQLAKEERQRHSGAAADVMQGAQVIACTLSGTGSYNLKGHTFDIVVVDEAAQALEISTWSALLKAPRAVLAGDHLQLPPTVLSPEAESGGLGRTLFERLVRRHGHRCGTMLTVQYRMHEAIMRWSSEELYGGRLEAHSDVARHSLVELPGARGQEESAFETHSGPSLSALESPLVFFDSTGCDLDEREDEEGSRLNEGEAEAALRHARDLVEAGVRPEDVGIISPYNGQVSLLRALRPEELRSVEISTVDGFQGREKEAIIISTVRANADRAVGFLSDRRRMNVAVTRARRQCALVGCGETLAGDPFLARLAEYFTEHGDYRCAQELLDPR